MPEFLAALGLEAGATAGADAALGAGAEAGLGSLAELTASGLPFAAGAGELGSVATGLGPAGVSAFDVAAPALTAAAGAGGISGASELAGAGLPFGPGVGSTGTVDAGAFSPFLASGNVAAAPFGDTTIPAGASPASGFGINLPTSTPGVTATGPTAGTPAGPFNLGSFDAAGSSVAPAAPGAVAPVGTAGAAPTDLASSATGTASATGPGAASTEGKSIAEKLSPSNLASNAVDSVTKNPLGIAAAGGLLGMAALNKPQTPGVGASAGPLNATAGQLSAQAPELMGYLTKGTLPAGMQTSVDAATKAAKTAAISNAAAHGQPTDPTKNTALATTLAQIDQQAIITTAELGQKLLTTGLSETQLSSDIYSKLAGLSQAEDAKMQQAIAAFAAALGGGNKGINLQLAK